jgi:dihydroorotate dehydrogenase
MIYSLLQKIMFSMDAEKAHHLALDGMDKAHKFGLSGLLKFDAPQVPCQLMGMNLPNPVGLAAGLDKNGAYINALSALGFGFIEVGTITPKPQDGNPKPRLFRLPEHQAIINRMGFNNDGIDAMIANIKKSQFKGILGINIGKNAVTPIENAVDDYLICLDKAYAHASYITINISSPNTKNLRALQGEDELFKLLSTLKNRQAQLASQHGRYVPLAVKIAPDLDDAGIAAVAQVTLQTEIDGVIATNTTIDKTSLGNHPLANEAGGLSGAPDKEPSNRVLAQLTQALDNKIPVIGVGGISSGQDAAKKIELGAKAVQLYSGMIYQGPKLIADSIKACQPLFK